MHLTDHDAKPSASCPFCREPWNRHAGTAAPAAYTIARVAAALRALIAGPRDPEDRSLAAIDEGNAALAVLAAEQFSIDTRNRDAGGWLVREAWIRWARTRPHPAPSWLVPYEDLAEHDKEADRQIYEACYHSIRGVGTEPLAWYNPETEAVIGWKTYEAGQRAGGATRTAMSGYTEPLHAPHRTGLPPDVLAAVADNQASPPDAHAQSASRYAYSHNDEDYHGDFASIAEALEEAFDDDDTQVCWIGEIATVDPADFFSADTLLDQAANQAYEEMGEHAEDYLVDLNEEARGELEGLLARWARKHAQPSFWRVAKREQYDRTALAARPNQQPAGEQLCAQ